MSEWTKVTWSTAEQIAGLIGKTAPRPPTHDIAPAAFFRTLVDVAKFDEASNFIGHALPRYEAVVWATQTLRTRTEEVPKSEDDLVTSILRWIDDPSDERRRSIRDEADGVGANTPATLLALAVYFSGGSISEPDLPPVLPPPDACGKFASAAVLTAAYAQPDSKDMLRNALRIGETIASGSATA